MSIGDINIFFDLLENALDHISSSFPKSELIMVGYFNMDLIKSGTQANRLIELTLPYNCLQQVTLPTRIQGSTKTLIDHVFINTKQESKTDMVMCDLSDHYATLTMFLQHRHKMPKQTVTKRWYTLETYKQMNILL